MRRDPHLTSLTQRRGRLARGCNVADRGHFESEENGGHLALGSIAGQLCAYCQSSLDIRTIHSRFSQIAMSEEQEEGEIVEEDGNTADPSVDKCSDPTGATGMEEYEERRVFYHSSSGYYYDPASRQYLVPMSWCSATCSGTSSVSVGEADKGGPPRAEKDNGEDGHDEKEGGDVKELLKRIADVSEEATRRSGLTFDDQSGMYYDAQSGLYYDQNSRLYYSLQYHCYYDYDQKAGKYRFHSAAEQPGYGVGGEDSDPTDTWRSSDVGEGEGTPCLRVVVTKSDKLNTGTVFIVTQIGADIGRDVCGHTDIRLPSIYISKLHAALNYDEDEGLYYIRDRGSVSGTFLNGERLSRAKEHSEAHPLSHGDQLVIGASTFELHLHSGMGTCVGCIPQSTVVKEQQLYGEPSSSNSGSLEEARKSILTSLKEKYGVTGSRPAVPSGYRDRAAKRRKLQGSEPPSPSPHPAEEVASDVHRPISESNIGSQMLRRMGWEEGKGLGRLAQGMREPIQTVVHEHQSGLGTSYTTGSLGEPRGTERWRRMQRRYEEVTQRGTVDASED